MEINCNIVREYSKFKKDNYNVILSKVNKAIKELAYRNVIVLNNIIIDDVMSFVGDYKDASVDDTLYLLNRDLYNDLDTEVNIIEADDNYSCLVVYRNRFCRFKDNLVENIYSIFHKVSNKIKNN